MEIAIKDNKRNWQIVKDNRRYLFPPKIRLAFKICILVYAVLVLINVLMRQFKLWMAFVLPIAIIVFEVQIYYFAKKTIKLQKERFKKETFHEMKIPVIFNTLGHEIEDQSIPEILEKQVMSPVYFEKSIRYMIDQGVDTIIEVGPGKVLSGFVRKIDRSIQLYQIEDMESLKKTVKALKGE